MTLADIPGIIAAHEAADQQLILERLAERETAREALEAVQAAVTVAQLDGTAKDARIAELEAEVRRLTDVITPPPVPPVVKPSPGLVFKRSDVVTDKKVIFHLYAPLGVTIDNAPEKQSYYAKTWMLPAGEGGKYAESGGAMRDMPISKAPYPGVWLRTSAAETIRYAQQFGVDGFGVNLMSAGTSHSKFYNAIRDEAAANFKDFLVIPSVDASDGASLHKDKPALINVVASFLTTPNAWVQPNGSVIVASFQAEKHDAAWWADLAAQLKVKTGKTVEFMHVFNSYTAANLTKAGKSAFAGPWSPGTDPAKAVTQTGIANTARATGAKFLAPIQAQNVRPRRDWGGWFDESLNTQALRAYLKLGIDLKADVLHGVTWDDFYEGSQFRPSVARGTAALQILAYYAEWWKTGKAPQILKDTIIVSHRNQTLDAKITGPQTFFMTQNTSRGTISPVRNYVEVLTYFTKPQKVTLKIGTNTHVYDAPAGEFAKAFPAIPGQVTVTTDAGLSHTSPFTIRSESGNQDRQYMMSSMLDSGLYDPTPVS